MLGDFRTQPATSNGNGGPRIARWAEHLWLGVLLLPLVWLFRRALFFGEMFAYRDSSHYYHPFYRYINERWQAGLPLWNPLDNLGQPLLADPTAAVAYPGKLLFALPLDYELCFAIYVVAHLWLAGCGLYWCAREFRATRQGAFIGALAYELGGQILFQYCNPIFCIGAAWLPFAVLLLERTLRHQEAKPNTRVRRNVILLAFTLAMMVYGGDPQMAYHFAIIATVRAMIPWGRHSRSRHDPVQSGSWSLWLRCVGANLLPIMSACLIALLLSALQVLPSIEWARQSDRATRTGASSVWSLLTESTRAANNDGRNGNSNNVDAADLWTRSKNNAGHGSRVYDFSVAPWRWVELLAPNISGSIFPENARWIRLLPGERIAWSPSLYMGLLPLLLACCRWKVTSGSQTIRWLTWITLLGIAAALGRYGVGWLVNELRYQVTPDPYEPSQLLPGFGGVYWFMTVMFPSYASFRYPAKWWTIAAFGLAMLAAKGWPALRAIDPRTIYRLSCGIAGLIVATVLAAALMMTKRNALPNEIFGPLQSGLAWRWILLAAIHTAVVLVAVLILRNNAHRRRLLWLVVFVDLAMAQTPLVQTVPVSAWNRPSGNLDSASAIYRSPARTAYPESWRRNATADRMKALKTNEIATLMPKHHLSHGIRSLHSGVSMASADYMALWSAFRSPPTPLNVAPKVVSPPANESNDEFSTPPLELLSALGADLIFSTEDTYDLPAALSPADIETNLVTYRNEHRFPRAWLVARWSNLGKAPTDHGTMQTRTQQIWAASSGIPDFRHNAWLEHEGTVPDPVASELVTELKPATANCELRVDEPERLVIHASVPVRSVLVVRDQFSPGWEAWTVSTTGSKPVRKRITVCRANRVMRAVILEPGDQTIEFRYRPKSVLVGAIITAVSLCAAVMVLARDFKSDS